MEKEWLVDNVEKRPRAWQHILSITKPMMYFGNSGSKMHFEIPEQAGSQEEKNEYRGDWAQMNMRVVVVEEDAIEEKHVNTTDDGPSVWD